MAVKKTGLARSNQRVSDAGVKMTTFIPMRIVRHKTNRVIVQPGAGGETTTGARVDATLPKALARGLYWQELLDSGRVANIAELAAAEGLEKVRLQKTLKLARLAPEVVERIASGRDPVCVFLSSKRPAAGARSPWRVDRSAFRLPAPTSIACRLSSMHPLPALDTK